MSPLKYNHLNELLAEHSILSAHLSEIESRVNKAVIDSAHPMLPEHAETKARIAEIESKLKIIAVESPELFPDDKKSHSTPFGALSFRAVSYLEIEDEEKTVLKILSACTREIDRAMKLNAVPRFTAETLLRTRQEPNLEALERLDDATLALFGIQRKTEEKFSVKPLEVKADKLAKKTTKDLKQAA